MTQCAAPVEDRLTYQLWEWGLDRGMFERMLTQFRDSPEALFLSSADVAYRPDAARLRLGLEFATNEQLEAFLTIVADPDADVARAVVHDGYSCRFLNQGIYVSVTGLFASQLAISNRPI
jgi:hypothetical protein